MHAEVNPRKGDQKNHKNADRVEKNPPKTFQIFVKNINQHDKKYGGDHGVVAGETRTESVNQSVRRPSDVEINFQKIGQKRCDVN